MLNNAKAADVRRIYLLVKQDENEYESKRTGRKLHSGEPLIELPGEKTAQGWENSDWLREMLTRAKTFGIEVFAWWPLFQDAVMAADFPTAVYRGDSGEAFVDPAVDGVGSRQLLLIEKHLASYPFDGVALEWIRYNHREDGSRGPLARRFEAESGKSWSKELMEEPLPRALWDDMRAETVSGWIEALVSDAHRQHPDVKWGAFVLPWQFKEVAQIYRRLGDVGLDCLQPMIYWADWNESAEFTSEVMRSNPHWLRGTTASWPTFDLNGDESGILEGVSKLNGYRLEGMTWYLHESWQDADFNRLNGLAEKWSGVAPDPKSDGEDLGRPCRTGGRSMRQHPFPSHHSGV